MYTANRDLISMGKDLAESGSRSRVCDFECLPPVSPSRVVVLALLGAYLNTAAFGFKYGSGNHEFELALVNWLKDPSLYPDDPITESFLRFPTFFWQAVAYASTWADTQLVLFIVFAVTKVLFFLALIRLVTGPIRDCRLIACIVCAVALSPFLNEGTPFSDSDVLNAVQTQTSLAIALLLWVNFFLLEGRWLSAAALLGFTSYVNSLFVIFVLFAFAGFILIDWRQRKREILSALILLGITILPYLMLSRGKFPTSFPKSYVEMLLARYPFHFTLRSHSVDELLRGSGVILAATCLIPLAVKLGITRYRRLELLIGFSLVPFLFGAFVGELFPVPHLMTMQFLRSDSFLVLYSIILVQIYGAKILPSAQVRSPAATWLLGVSAVFLPLSDGFVLLILLLTGMLIVAGPETHFKQLCHHIAQPWIATTLIVAILTSAIISARLLDLRLSIGTIIALAALSAFFAATANPTAISARQGRLALTLCELILVAATVSSIPSSSRLWNPVIAPDQSEVAWREVQQWAKVNTPRNTKFLVPPVLGGFRVFSERVSWVDWKDGVIVFTFPSYADEWLRRMGAISILLPPFPGRSDFSGMKNDYKKQSWEHLLTVAREEKIDYVVQFKEVLYSISPVFANEKFAVYRTD